MWRSRCAVEASAAPQVELPRRVATPFLAFLKLCLGGGNPVLDGTVCTPLSSRNTPEAVGRLLREKRGNWGQTSFALLAAAAAAFLCWSVMAVKEIRPRRVEGSSGHPQCKERVERLGSQGEIFKGWFFSLRLFCFHEVVLAGALWKCLIPIR